MFIKRFVFIICAILWMGSSVYGQLEERKIAMIVAKKDFRDEELLVPKSVFEKAGFNVVIFSDSLGNARGMLGAVVDIDDVVNNLHPADYSAIIFVGGVGASTYWNNKTAHRIARDTLANNKVLGAICIAPVILANAGVLNGRRATVWPSEGRKLESRGAIYTGKDVEIDGYIVTANGPQSAQVFAEAIVSLISH